MKISQNIRYVWFDFYCILCFLIYNNDFQEDDLLRPRYTTAELKEILAERDDLKARINDLEEELKLFKPSPPLHSKKPIVCET